MNFGELQSYVQDVLGRTDIPQAAYILAQDDWDRQLKLQKNQITVTLASPYTLPTDFLAAIDVRFNDVRLMPVAALPDYTQAGTPDRFRVDAGALELWPTTTESVTMTYAPRVARLVNSGDTNTVLTKFENVAVYGTLLQTCVLIRDAEGQAAFGPMYQKAIADAQEEEQRTRFGGGRLVPVPREVA